jgi:hypothetical protein
VDFSQYKTIPLETLGKLATQFNSQIEKYVC